MDILAEAVERRGAKTLGVPGTILLAKCSGAQVTESVVLRPGLRSSSVIAILLV